MTLIKWKTIAGVPVHYARNLSPSLRNEGRPVTSRTTRGLKTKLDAAFQEIFRHSGLGKADVIVTAGTFVNRNQRNSNKKSAHASGLAFDLDGIIWHHDDNHPEKAFYCIDFDADPAFYWGVGGILNRHLRHVLHARYNTLHHDHYHVEDTRPPGFSTSSRATVGFLQAALTHVHATPVAMDGKWGKQTAAATQSVLDRLGVSGELTDVGAWKSFNLHTAKIGMSRGAPAGTDDPDRAKDPSHKLAGQPEAEHELPPEKQTSAVRLKLTTPRMRGDNVKVLQRALRDFGFDAGRADGIFGDRTRSAVIAFQQAKELGVDGIVGPITAAALGITL